MHNKLSENCIDRILRVIFGAIISALMSCMSCMSCMKCVYISNGKDEKLDETLPGVFKGTKCESTLAMVNRCAFHNINLLLTVSLIFFSACLPLTV